MADHSDLGDLTQHARNCGYWSEQTETDCNCGLRYRVMLATERELHAAWRKRAEDAEARVSLGGHGEMISCDPAPNAARGLPAISIGRTYKL